MKIATWNVNSIRARFDNVKEWILESQIDVLLMQEIKCETHAFPLEAMEELGYNIAVYGQKTFNGVAVFSKYPLEEVQYGFPSFQDPQARYIEAVTKGVRVASVYVPNGQEIGSDKYTYKLDFLEKLRQHLAHLLTYEEKCVIGGDYNIAPTDEDVSTPKDWEGQILCSPLERKAFNALLHLGYKDAGRLTFSQEKTYTWWDYRAKGWERNEGLRIDHLLLSPEACDSFIEAGVDTTPRGKEKPSDHAPFWCSLKE